MKPIFLHSLFRAGSTYLWNKFRCHGSCYCYYEPLNSSVADSLESLKPHCSREVALDMRHPEVSLSYFDEYPRNDAGLVPFYQKEFAYGRQPGNQQESDDLKKYLDSLIANAEHSGRRPLLEFCRTAYLQDWLRQHYQTENIFILRDARAQWESYCSFDSGFFTGNHLLMLASNKNSPLLQPLQDVIYLPQYSSSTVITEIEFYHYAVEPLLGLERTYFLFYYLWLITFLESWEYCRLVIDINGLSCSPEIRRNCERGLAEMGIKLDFSDCRIAEYKETHLTQQQMQRIEGDVEHLISVSFPVKIALANTAIQGARKTFLPAHFEIVERLHSLSEKSLLNSQLSQSQVASSLLPPQNFFSRDEFDSSALETLFQYVQENNDLHHKLNEPLARTIGRHFRHSLRKTLRLKQKQVACLQTKSNAERRTADSIVASE